MEMIVCMKSGKNTVPSPTETENSILCVGKKGMAGQILWEHLEYFSETVVSFSNMEKCKIKFGLKEIMLNW